MFDRVSEKLQAKYADRTEEIFWARSAFSGSPVPSFDAALVEANATEYGLTGAVYSQDADRVKRAMDRFECGNLYINRKCTGAMVGGHPFGGFNMSGTDSKAGGPD